MRTVDNTVEDTVEKSVASVMGAAKKPVRIPRLPARWLRSFGSLRTQLILWNFVALSLLVGGLGVVCRYAIYSYLLQSVDHELDQSIDRYMRPPRKDHGPPDGPNGKIGKATLQAGAWGRDRTRNMGWAQMAGENPPFGEPPPDERGPGGMGKHFGGPPEGFPGGKHGPHPPDENSQFRPHQYNSKQDNPTLPQTRAQFGTRQDWRSPLRERPFTIR